MQRKNVKNGQILIEKSGLSHMRSFVMVIRSVYFGAKKRRNYAKSIGVNRSGIFLYIWMKFTLFIKIERLSA